MGKYRRKKRIEFVEWEKNLKCWPLGSNYWCFSHLLLEHFHNHQDSLCCVLLFVWNWVLITTYFLISNYIASCFFCQSEICCDLIWLHYVNSLGFNLPTFNKTCETIMLLIFSFVLHPWQDFKCPSRRDIKASLARVRARSFGPVRWCFEGLQQVFRGCYRVIF